MGGEKKLKLGLGPSFQTSSFMISMMRTAKEGLSQQMRAAIGACAKGVSRALESFAEWEAAMLVVAAERETAPLQLIAECETAMFRAVVEERVAALQALAERETETSAGREALAADSEIGAMADAVQRQDSRVPLSVGGALFETSRTTLTAVPGSMLEAMFSGRYTITVYEDGRVFIDRDGEHFRLILNFLHACGSDAATDAIRALPDTQLREVRGELDCYGLDDAAFRGWFSLERASFVPGPEMGHGARLLLRRRAARRPSDRRS